MWCLQVTGPEALLDFSQLFVSAGSADARSSRLSAVENFFVEDELDQHATSRSVYECHVFGICMYMLYLRFSVQFDVSIVSKSFFASLLTASAGGQRRKFEFWPIDYRIGEMGTSPRKPRVDAKKRKFLRRRKQNVPLRT